MWSVCFSCSLLSNLNLYSTEILRWFHQCVLQLITIYLQTEPASFSGFIESSKRGKKNSFAFYFICLKEQQVIYEFSLRLATTYETLMIKGIIMIKGKVFMHSC